MKIEVLGTGCAKCNKLEETTKRAADQLGIEYTLDHVKDILKITEYGVMTTPALVVDGQVKVMGKVPSEEELRKILASQS